jgi:hypothetical protein
MLYQNWRATVSLKQVLCVPQGFGEALMPFHGYYYEVDQFICVLYAEAG